MNLGQQRFGVFVINLDRSPDRLDRIARNLDGAGLGFERVVAVDGRDLNLNAPQLDPTDMAYWARYHHRVMRVNEVACYMSHIKALRQFLATDFDAALILEDDAVVADDITEVIAGLGRHANAWDLVKLYASHPGTQVFREQLTGKHKLISYLTQTGRSAGYIVSREAAEKLLKQLLPIRLPFDHIFDRNFEHGLRVRGVTPMPVCTSGETSTIGYGDVPKLTGGLAGLLRKWGDPPYHRRWRVPIYRLGLETRRLAYNLFVDGGLRRLVAGSRANRNR